ncbi:MAG TPA: hypothetical protein V6D11_15045 [Waterburya sp.]
MSLPALKIAAVAVECVGNTSRIAAQALPRRNVLKFDVGADANDIPLLETAAVAVEHVGNTSRIACQTLPRREVFQYAVGCDANNVPLLKTAAVAVERINFTRAIAVETLPRRDVLVRLQRIRSQGCYGTHHCCNNGSSPDNQVPYRFVHSSLLFFLMKEE